MKIKFVHNLQDIADSENLLAAWKEFVKGKRTKIDVQQFNFNLVRNVLELHNNLLNKKYKHGGYKVFKIYDPKPRIIHKATVRDRLVHHAMHRILYPFFDRIFIADSFSCRNEKGIHKALMRNTRTCWVLKCDIKKFFANVDHKILSEILNEYIVDDDVMWLFRRVMDSFNNRSGIGLPLGNLTSQLFANIYMDKFDQFVKHKLKAKYYIRYTDDFVILSSDKNRLLNLIPPIKIFLEEELKLEIHPNKISVKTFASGTDFLGWVNFSYHKNLRTTTKKRMFNKISDKSSKETTNSYLGLLGHGNTFRLQQKILAITQDNEDKGL